MLNRMQRVKLTDEPISEELWSVLEKLDNGEYVAMEEINATPEIQTARTNVNTSQDSLSMPHRFSIQAKIFNTMMERGSYNGVDFGGNPLYNGNVIKSSRLDLVIGLSGSGKSSAIVDDLSSYFHSRVIDNDAVKELIPQYNGGWGATVVHNESKMIEQNIFWESLERQDNIVIAKVGSDSATLYEQYIKPAKEKGYTVNLHYVELDRNKALGRMLSRFVTTGRFLEPELIEKYAPMGRNKVEECYEQLKKEGVLNGYSKWNNDVEFGKSAKLIESRGESVRFCDSKNGRGQRDTNGRISSFYDGERERINEYAGNRENGNFERGDRQEGFGYGDVRQRGRDGTENTSLLGREQGYSQSVNSYGEIQESGSLQNDYRRKLLVADIAGLEFSANTFNRLSKMDIAGACYIAEYMDYSTDKNEINVIGFENEKILTINPNAELGVIGKYSKPSELKGFLETCKQKGYNVNYHYVSADDSFMKPSNMPCTAKVSMLCELEDIVDGYSRVEILTSSTGTKTPSFTKCYNFGVELKDKTPVADISKKL